MAQPINRSLFGFEAQTMKPSWWFWGTDHQTAAASFEAQTIELVATDFEAKPGENITSFKAKQEKPSP
jgi:hypothetical protein